MSSVIPGDSMKEALSKKKRWLRWGILGLCLLGGALSLWLSIEKITGNISNLAGCGQGSGCNDVLGSKWSVLWKLIPVSIVSLGLYFVTACSLWIAHPVAVFLRRLAMWLFLGAAVWFTALQLWVIGEICRYCMVMHILGVSTAIGLALFEPKMLTKRALLPALPLAVIGVATLAVIQIYGPVPDTYQVDEVRGDLLQLPEQLPDELTSKTRRLSYLDGKLTFRLGEYPFMGSKEAPHVIVKYFDYTCAACRKAHLHVQQTLMRRPDEVAVILLPVPLNPDCNPHFPLRQKEHANACFLAHYAYTVWVSKPAAFSEYHDWLMNHPFVDVNDARAKAESLVGKEVFQRELRNPKVRKMMDASISHYAAFVHLNPVMPKILLGQSLLMHGKAQDADAFEASLKEKLRLKDL